MRFVFLIVFSFLAGCVQTVELSSTFNPDEVAFINKAGGGEISGQAFLTRNDGIVVYAAGQVVYLIPAGRYADERIQALYGGRKIAYFAKKFENEDPRYRKMTRNTKADGEGRFSFTGLADGRYYVNTRVIWKAGDIYQGGSLVDTATIKGGNQTTVIMNGV